MRFLCLHGKGTSGAIFRNQTATFRSYLDPDKYTFDFIDAPHKTDPAWGLDALFLPPNYTFWEDISPPSIADAHVWLLDFMRRQPQPYDGVLCFSQGCAVISSLILFHQNEHPEEPLPFKSVVFICGGIPLPALEHIGIHVPERAWQIHNQTAEAMSTQIHTLQSEVEEIVQTKSRPRTRQKLPDENLEARGLERTRRRDTGKPHLLPEFGLHNVYGLDITLIPDCLRINIPTVHIYGSKDPRYPCSIQLAHFSKPEIRRVYDHGGGHEIPVTTRVSSEIALAVEWLASVS
ncbi:hypothetical protein DIZ76_014153 [Coccidioides immitis]|uniref:Serine hydrolase domain-containing protein n=2 Tax=Coccidioides immitis TaxID=5501 RepID=A0A0J8R6D4_COCIT|nr:hypothetical protein CIRG_06514 [Coccidioides immitis RMSCC 2394]KMU79288.1 hypothetical protein CISG_07719 [Coccidioides immitis RMSCC 3703]TPX22285.1 hypothetical protein DIZ76_014153 [Coccidioides immitis]